MIEIIYTSALAEVHYADTGTGPAYATPGSAAFDLRAMINGPLHLHPGQQAMVQTGIKLNMNGIFYGEDCPLGDGHFGSLAALVIPRSGRGSKEGLNLGNSTGLIDRDFLGEIMLCCWARPQSESIVSFQLQGEGVTIQPGERIAQLLFVPILRPAFKVVSQFSTTTERGEGGFGSTGQ